MAPVAVRASGGRSVVGVPCPCVACVLECGLECVLECGLEEAAEGQEALEEGSWGRNRPTLEEWLGGMI
jgi:hypothetical protein